MRKKRTKAADAATVERLQKALAAKSAPKRSRPVQHAGARPLGTGTLAVSQRSQCATNE
jgi:hypothetical protein